MMLTLTPYRKNHAAAYDPFREFEDLQKSLFNAYRTVNDMPGMETDVKDLGDSYLIEADLPGFKKEDIRLNLNGDTLSLEAERHLEHEDKDKKGNYLLIERSSGKYMRSFDVSNVDTEKISAKYDNGVLALTLPKKQPAQPASRQLEIE